MGDLITKNKRLRLRRARRAKRELLKVPGFPLRFHEVLNDFPLRQVILARERFESLRGLFGKLNSNGHGTWFPRGFLRQGHA